MESSVMTAHAGVSVVRLMRVCILLSLLFADAAKAEAGYFGDTTYDDGKGQILQLMARWLPCNVTGCSPEIIERLEDPPQCPVGYAQIEDVSSNCPRCDSRGRCADCLLINTRLCGSFGHRLKGSNGSCEEFDVQRPYKVRRCSRCHEDCQSCSGPSSRDCTQCKSGKVLIAGACVEPWIFVVLGACCGIGACVIAAAIVIIVKRRNSKASKVRLRNGSTSSRKSGSQRSTGSQRSSGTHQSGVSHNSKWVDTKFMNGVHPSGMGGYACSCHANITREPSHYSAIQDPDPAGKRTSSQYEGLRTYQSQSAHNTLTKHPVYEPLRQTRSANTETYSSLEDERATGAAGGGALETSHYTPLCPPLQPSYDATYAHPNHYRGRAQSLYAGRVTSVSSSSRAESSSPALAAPEASRARLHDNRYNTAPSKARMKAGKKPLPLFSRWSCVAPNTSDTMDKRHESNLEREPSWRYKAASKDDDGNEKQDLWISAVTIDKDTSKTAATVNAAKSEAPAIRLHHLVEKQLSDPSKTPVNEHAAAVRRSSSFNKTKQSQLIPSATEGKIPLQQLKSSPQSKRRLSPLLQNPLQLRKATDEKKAQKKKKPKVLPRWSMVPDRTLRLAEKRQQSANRSSGASSGTYEEAKVVSQLDTLSHYYHVLEKAPFPEDKDDRWQYDSNPTLHVQRGERVRKAMSLAPGVAHTRSHSLSHDDLMFVESLVNECGLEGEHDIVVPPDDNTVDDAEQILEESSETESRGATQAEVEPPAAAASNLALMREMGQSPNDGMSTASTDNITDVPPRSHAKDAESTDTFTVTDDDLSSLDEGTDDNQYGMDSTDSRSHPSHSQDDSMSGDTIQATPKSRNPPVPAPRLQKGRLSNSQDILAVSMDALDSTGRDEILQSWSLPVKSLLVDHGVKHSILYREA